ncbi:ABC transporter ATP-binding protein [Bdellovibrio sp. HCB337]|uniref:ABC transporter ATP-binding protein n=1 Tax=Bdellovibrio sp. HCB337 TaxID=3394358 RepID=UPI0039A4BB5D
MSPTAVEFIGIHKKFGDCVSADGLNFKIASGEIHAIVGENGAGKSTSMKILFGLYKPDSGTLKVHGKEVYFESPTEAMDLGIGMVHQHFMLAEPLSALDNILLFQKHSKTLQKLNRKEHLARLQKLAAQYQFNIDWEKPVGQLSVGTQQRIEILKILSQDSKIIILDEPTAVLTPQETEDLFVNLRKLKAEGRTIIIITHKLKEVMAVADSVTVLRNTKVVTSKSISATSLEDLAEHMVGRKIKNLSLSERTHFADQNFVLKVTDLNLAGHQGSLKHLNLQVRTGEILGIAGVEGNGQDPLIQALLDPHSLKIKGQIEIKAQSTLKLSPSQVRSLGLAAFPEDRLRLGVLAERPLYENFILGYHNSAEYSSHGFLKFKNIFEKTKAAMEKFDVRPRDIQKPIGKLSGGNQQKLVVARELQNNPDFILAAKPTRGVDIGAIEFIHEQLLAARNHGAGILLVSSELEELMTLSDRILVLFKGQIVAEFLRENQYDEKALGAAMGGHA